MAVLCAISVPGGSHADAVALEQRVGQRLEVVTVCTVDFAAVHTAAGIPNPEGDAAVQEVSQSGGQTAAPDLESVGNFRTDVQGRIYVDFSFDEEVLNAPAPPRFKIITTDDREFRGDAVFASTDSPGKDPFNPPAKVVSVRFTATQQDVPFSQIARGVVEEDTVCDAADHCNALQAADTSAASTLAPDLMSARAVSATQVEYTFDQPVSASCPGTSSPDPSASPEPCDPDSLSFPPEPGQFGIYDASAQWDTANSAVRSQEDARVVIATFDRDAAGDAPAGRTAGVGGAREPVNVPVSAAMGAFVFQGAVTQSENPNTLVYNRDDEESLQQIGFLAGRTTRPDLAGVRVFTDPVSQRRIVRYTFDQSVRAYLEGETSDDFTCSDFHLYDAQATRFSPTARAAGDVTEPCTVGGSSSPSDVRSVSGDDNSVDVYGFTNAEADAAVLGTVNDTRNESASGNHDATVMRFPEGAEPVQRS